MLLHSIILSKPIEQGKKTYTTPIVNHNINYELWVNVMNPYRFINENKYTNVVQDVNNGKVVWVRTGHNGNTIISAQLYYEPKTSLRKLKSIKNFPVNRFVICL